MKKIFLAFVCGLVVATSALAQTSTPPPENTGTNSNIVRWAEGKYVYQTVKEKRQRGWEKFHLNVHPDGSRTMIMWHDLLASNNQFTVVLRVGPDFRPLESYLSYWTPNGYKGSNFILVNGMKLNAVTNGPTGQVTQALDVPQSVSIGSHPVAADGWHTWYENADVIGPQKGTLYSVEATDDNNKPPLGTLIPFQFERIGPEKIKTPAGTFDTIKYKLGSASEAWLLGPDKIMVKVVNAPRNLEYVLTEFKAGENPKKP